MKTSIYFHPVFLDHDTGSGHPESADRLRSILTELRKDEFKDLIWKEPTAATKSQISLVHLNSYIDKIFESIPNTGKVRLDEDTVISPKSLVSALHAVGAVCLAIDDVITGNVSNVFCAVRPPGHHAEPQRAMGFCFFNNIAIAANYAKLKYKIKKCAVIDFDVHHGNGTQKMFWNDPNMFYASTHQEGIFPGTGFKEERGINNNIVNVPLPAGTESLLFKKSYEDIIIPNLKRFSPDIIFISAGFDAHVDDPLADFRLTKDDFYWITKVLNNFATKHCKGKLISCLEGGYNIKALSESCLEHVKGLIL